MASWPATLPQLPMASGFSESPPDTTVRTKMDAGPAKVRRRFTANVRPIKASFLMTTAQIADLDTFYVTTTVGGSASFTWIDPRTSSSKSFRFMAPPEYNLTSGDYWSVSLQLEQLP